MKAGCKSNKGVAIPFGENGRRGGASPICGGCKSSAWECGECMLCAGWEGVERGGGEGVCVLREDGRDEGVEREDDSEQGRDGIGVIICPAGGLKRNMSKTLST